MRKIGYAHPWCNKQFTLDDGYGYAFYLRKALATPQMVCIEECEPNSCDIALKRFAEGQDEVIKK